MANDRDPDVDVRACESCGRDALDDDGRSEDGAPYVGPGLLEADGPWSEDVTRADRVRARRDIGWPEE